MITTWYNLFKCHGRTANTIRRDDAHSSSVRKVWPGAKKIHVPRHGLRPVPVLILGSPHPAALADTLVCSPEGVRTPESASEVWPHARRAKVCLSFLNICGASSGSRYGLFACTRFCETVGIIRCKDWSDGNRSCLGRSGFIGLSTYILRMFAKNGKVVPTFNR